ncbi:hypothetical protein B0H14DRAFT_3489969 [Mycena olivaceomarginata]|nr:hypothetical protein B0H14DRAFT_3489969 [Mycena olivaceomarginata]
MSYLPEFLKGLLKYLSDPTEDVRVATETLLADFVHEIRDVSTVRKRAEEQAKSKADSSSRSAFIADDDDHSAYDDESALMRPLTSTIGILGLGFLDKAEVMVPFTPRLVPAILPNLAHHVTMIQSAAIQTNKLLLSVIQALASPAEPPSRPVPAPRLPKSSTPTSSTSRQSTTGKDSSRDVLSPELIPESPPLSRSRTNIAALDPSLTPRLTGMGPAPLPGGSSSQSGALEAAKSGSGDLFAFGRHYISNLAAHHPDLAYLHLVEPRINGNTARNDGDVAAHESNDSLRALWAPRPLIRAGGSE